MKSNFISILLTTITVFSLMITSCEKDNPTTPEDETLNKDHEDPVKAELILAEGHLHGDYGFHQNAAAKGMKYLKQIQKITYTLSAKSGWAPTEDSPKKFIVRATETEKDGAAIYGLWIYYYNAKGEIINSEFIENGQDQIHQHFFTAKDIVPTFDGKEENIDDTPSLFEYTYCDTDPWDKTIHDGEATVIGKENPIGFKGFFWFKKARKQFNLNISLMHATKSKFYDKGKVSPYYKPTSAQIQTNHWDLKIEIPILIFVDSYEYLEAESSEIDFKLSDEEIFKTLSENDRKYTTSIMKAYNITLKETLKELFTNIEGNIDYESGELWF